MLLVMLLSTPAAAQKPDRLPWFTIDVHAGTVRLPTAEGWVPVVPANTELPGRAWGAMFGGTVYPLRLGVATFGVGAALTKGTGTRDPVQIVSGTGAAATLIVTPRARTSVTHLTPQLSINFGQKLGWSYLSAGIGRTKVTSSVDAVGATPGVVVPDSWNSAINFGGGAKWFMKPHLGAGFDVRFVKLASRSETATLPSAMRTQVWTISAGISIQ